MHMTDATLRNIEEKKKAHSSLLFDTIESKTHIVAKPKVSQRTAVDKRRPLERKEMLEQAKKNHSRFRKFQKPTVSIYQRVCTYVCMHHKILYSFVIHTICTYDIIS